MKIKSLFLIIGINAFMGITAYAATAIQDISLNSPPEGLYDSFGDYLDGTYTAQLGTYTGTFDILTLAANWVTFATTTITSNPNPIPGGQFQLDADLNDDGTSSYYDNAPESSLPNASFDFSNTDAWLWVYNGTDITTPGTEWFLGRADSWVFPDGSGGCCGETEPILWALDDFSGETPIWGSQQGIEGLGEASDKDPSYDLQTYLVPEMGTLGLMGLSLSTVIFFALFRRKGDLK